VALSAVLASHLDVVVFSNDEVSVDFLDNTLFRRRHLCRHLLFLRDLAQIPLVIFRLVLVGHTLMVSHVFGVFPLGFCLGCLLQHAPVVEAAVRPVASHLHRGCTQSESTAGAAALPLN